MTMLGSKISLKLVELSLIPFALKSLKTLPDICAWSKAVLTNSNEIRVIFDSKILVFIKLD